MLLEKLVNFQAPNPLIRAAACIVPLLIHYAAGMAGLWDGVVSTVDKPVIFIILSLLSPSATHPSTVGIRR